MLVRSSGGWGVDKGSADADVCAGVMKAKEKLSWLGMFVVGSTWVLGLVCIA